MSSIVHRFVIAVAIVATLGLLSARSASAQLADNLTFKTWLPFVVGNATLPAGSYTIQRVDDSDQSILLIRGMRSALLQVNPVGHAPAVGADKDEVIFTKYGDQFVMSEIWEGDASTGVASTVKFKGERLARGEDRPMTSIPSQVTVLASR